MGILSTSHSKRTKLQNLPWNLSSRTVALCMRKEISKGIREFITKRKYETEDLPRRFSVFVCTYVSICHKKEFDS